MVGEAVRSILEAQDNEIYTDQPVGCSCSMTFLIDASKLSNCEDIRADDLGVWINKGMKSTFCLIKIQGDAVQKVNILDHKPSVKRTSLYRLKRTYWVHAEDKRVSRCLFELEGNTMQLCAGTCCFK